MTAEARIVREMLIQPHDQRPALVDPFLRATLSPNPESDQPANPHMRSPEPKSSTRVETLRWASQHCSLGCNLNWRAGQATSLLVSSLFASKKGMEKRVMNEGPKRDGLDPPRLVWAQVSACLDRRIFRMKMALQACLGGVRLTSPQCHR